MDMRSKFSALALLMVFGGTLLYASYRVWKSAVSVQSQLGEFERDTERRLPLDPARVGATAPRRDPDGAVLRNQQLQAQLNRVNAQLNQMSNLLKRVTAENKELKEDFDNSLWVAYDLLLKDRTAEEAAEFEGLSRDTSRAELLEQLLDEMRAELSQTRKDIVSLEEGAVLDEVKIAALEAEQRSLQAAASRALIQAGASAVPALIEMLDNKHPDVRRFAAQTLGEIGQDAQNAVPTLMDLRSDANERVREAARRAIEQIELR